MKMNTKEVADILKRPHHDIFKKVSCLLVEHPEHQASDEFVLTKFTNSHKQKNQYPCYEMTEKGCETLVNWLQGYQYYRTIEPQMKELKLEIRNRFHPKEMPKWVDFGDISLTGMPKAEYAGIRKLYESFVVAAKDQEKDIEELTKSCDRFYETVARHLPKTKDNNEVMSAMYDVLGDAQMQGFLYGYILGSIVSGAKESVA